VRRSLLLVSEALWLSLAGLIACLIRLSSDFRWELIDRHGWVKLLLLVGLIQLSLYLFDLVRSGLTGWAQVRFSYGASLDDAAEKLRYDLYYIKNQSWLLDARIIFETVKIVLFGRGAR
jgi:hypothetical protein